MLEIARKGVYKYRFNESYLDNFDAVIRENPRDNDSYFDVPYSKYFHVDKTRDKLQMNKSLLEKSEYIKHDLVRDPNPFDEVFDLIICRNVIIYFNYDLQNKVFKLFLDNMNPGPAWFWVFMNRSLDLMHQGLIKNSRHILKNEPEQHIHTIQVFPFAGMLRFYSG